MIKCTSIFDWHETKRARLNKAIVGRTSIIDFLRQRLREWQHCPLLLICFDRYQDSKIKKEWRRLGRKKSMWDRLGRWSGVLVLSCASLTSVGLSPWSSSSLLSELLTFYLLSWFLLPDPGRDAKMTPGFSGVVETGSRDPWNWNFDKIYLGPMYFGPFFFKYYVSC